MTAKTGTMEFRIETMSCRGGVHDPEERAGMMIAIRGQIVSPFTRIFQCASKEVKYGVTLPVCRCNQGEMVSYHTLPEAWTRQQEEA